MRQRPSRGIALFLAAALLAGNAAAECKLTQLGEWKVRVDGNQPIIDGAINGVRVPVLLDTGATTSMVTRDTAEKLDLARRPARGVSMLGVGGEQSPEVTQLAEFRLGESIRKDWKVLVADTRASARFGFILGDDFFEQVDLELDLPRGAMRFYRSEGCERANLAYWNPQAGRTVKLESGGKPEFRAELDGNPVRALLDTGAAATVVTLPVARSAGFKPDAPDVVPAGCTAGIGARTADAWYARFDRLLIGNQLVRNPTLTVSDLWHNARRAAGGSFIRRPPRDVPEMLLGMDFLRTHRVFVTRAHGKMFFTYEGGVIFPSTPRDTCSRIRDLQGPRSTRSVEQQTPDDPGRPQ